ncbi:hypothetical protein J4Q44_G00151880 [Coregonus suidteri]|uniref:Uncharacterized protein n=1 Tax=Coregonus suidteri TaxID=861788 RepID=A0AAN8QRM3_9TELE
MPVLMVLTVEFNVFQNVKRLKEETSFLEEKWAELDINDTVLQEWVAEMYGISGLKPYFRIVRRGISRRRLTGFTCVKQRKHYLYRLTAAIVELHEQQAEFRRPTVDDLLSTDNCVWPWERLGTRKYMIAEGNGHFAILDKLMLVNRLQEEERILGQEMKRHWGRR